MSTTSLNSKISVINHPKAPSTSLMDSLTQLHQQNLAYAVGDLEVQHLSTPGSQTGGRKTYQIRQKGGLSKSFSVKAKNLKEAVAKGFLELGQKNAYFQVNRYGGRGGKHFYGQQRKARGGRKINHIYQMNG